jgi:chorismate synthase
MFRITTWGESHGKAIGVVIDGCPAGIEICEDEINMQMALRSPGRNAYTSPRKEKDQVEIYSGVFEGKTTGAPISLIILNHDSNSHPYEQTKHLLRPGHANYTYLQKYGIYDYRGGGRASARETACRVAAGAIAKKFLQQYHIFPRAYIKEIGGIIADIDVAAIDGDPHIIYDSPLFCPDPIATQLMIEKIEQTRQEKNSLGGIVELYVGNVPVGLGDPVYEKMDAMLASAMMGIPASKGFEMGTGFAAARMSGSEHNDRYISAGQGVCTETNHAGGVLGGITNGMPLIARIIFKPTSSIMQSQKTVDLNGQAAEIALPEGSRHDPCIAIRAVPVVEAMAALVLADAMLLNRGAR